MQRHYSKSAAATDKEADEPIVTAITSTECKNVNNNENLVQWFIHRQHTCASLRLCDAGKIVSLVGWPDKKNPKFMHLSDGYGNTQILIDDEHLKSILDKAQTSDLLLVEGRVLARPQTHVTRNCSTGEIELYADKIEILNPTVPYRGLKAHTQSDGIAADCAKPANVNEFTYRSHNCGELRETDIGKEVTLCGWLEYSRMKRFFTLRDGYGHTQVLIPDHVSVSLILKIVNFDVILSSKHIQLTFQLINTVNIKSLDFETILKVKGKVISRPENMKNKNMKTGDIEVEVISCDVLNKSLPNLTVQVRSFNRSNEALRMKYRYVDLRFQDMQRNLRMRSNVLMKMREYLINAAGFVEVETPTLFRRTPGVSIEIWNFKLILVKSFY